MSAKEKKGEYFKRLHGLFEEYQKMFVVDIDMVGSKQIQNVRMQIRGKGELIFGKNTLVRKFMRMHQDQLPQLKTLIDCVGGNTGFLFIKGDFGEIQDILKDNFVGAAARANVIAPVGVTVPAGVTGLQPTETSFFQALNIPTKITKGAIEILNDVNLIQQGKKVSPGAAALLQKLNIRPFTYGLQIVHVVDGESVFDAAILSITDADLIASFQASVQQAAAVCLAADFPTLVSVPHSIINGYKNVLAVSLATDYTFPLAQKIKDFLSDPAAMAAAAAAAAAPAASGGAAPAAAKEEAPVEEEEEEEEDMDFDLFD